MKRLGSSDSLGALISMCPSTTDEHNNNNQGNSNHVYTREFQSMLEGLDEEGCVEESGQMAEKKRRLSVDQVKALEKNFEVENKLEPERKVKLAQELGLQPRQVAVWFQNRRARWKTKQLERDYGVLKANYDALKHNYETLQHENEALLKEIRELKAKLNEDKDDGKVSVKEEAALSESEEKVVMDHEDNSKPLCSDSVAKCDAVDVSMEMNFERYNINNNSGNCIMGASVFADFKDGSSDSDSSAILNEDTNNNNGCSPNAAVSYPPQFMISNASSSSSNMNNNGFQFDNSSCSSSSKGMGMILGEAAMAHKQVFQTQFVKIEEHNFFSGEDSACSFFPEDQAPTLHWYCPEEWN